MRKIILLYGVLFFTTTCQLAMAQTAAQYLKKSDDYWSMGRFDSALKYAWLAEPLVADSTTRNSKEYSYFMGQYFSMNHEAAGNTDSASYWYRFSLNMFESLKDTASNEYGETLVNYGNMLISQSYYNDAQPYLQKSVVVMQNHQENVNGYLASLNNLGNYYNYCGEYSNAIAFYHKCLDGLTQQPLQISYLSQTATLLQNLATLNAKIGNIKEAELYYEKASVFFKKTQNLYGYYEAKKILVIFTFL